MSFSVTDPYTVLTPGVGVTDPATVEQAGQFYAVRLFPPSDPTQETFDAHSLGPYATQAEAATHLNELPPAPPIPPPFIPPLPEPK